jgi:hypothetical protein
VKNLEISKFDLDLRKESLSERDYDIERNCILERKFRVPDKERFGMEKSSYVEEVSKLSRIVVCE